MKISKIVTMKNLDTSKDEGIKLGTKEIREFNFPKKDYIINKVFIDNLWLKITLIIWFLILIVLLMLARIGQSYGFLAILIFISLITITLVANFQIARLYFFSEEGNCNIEKRLITSGMWASIKEVKPKNCTEAEEIDYSFAEKVFEEINKFAIRFYFSHLAFALTLLLMATMLLIAESQPDERASIFVVVAWIFTEFYFWKIRYFIRAKAEANYSIDLIDDDSTKESAVLEVKFSLNGNYIIEE